MTYRHPLALVAAVSIAATSASAFAETPPAAEPAPARTVIVVHDPPLAPAPPPAPRQDLILVPRERRSTAAMVTGIVLMSAGAVAVSGAAVAGMGDCFQACGNRDDVVRGLVIGGFVGIIAGIPLVIYGAKRVPIDGRAPQAVVPAWIGAPGGAGWQWRF